MKLAIQSTILAALFFTVVLGTPVKGRPMALSESPTCSMKITCDECIAVKRASGSLCGYSRTDATCVELSPTSPSSLKLVNTTADCKLIASEVSILLLPLLCQCIADTLQQSSLPTPDARPPKRTNAAQSNMKTHEGHKEKPAGGNPPVQSRSNSNTGTTVVATAPTVHPLPPVSITCGVNTYSRSNIEQAIMDGLSVLNTGTKAIRRRRRLKKYENYEGLPIDPGCGGNYYYEFPILTQGPYPGVDRVIFEPSGNYCAVITHTGAAKNNGFVSCVEPDHESSTATPSST